MSDEPRKNDRLINMEERSFDVALFSGDNGMWTVFESIKRPIAQAPSEFMALKLIERIKGENKP